MRLAFSTHAFVFHVLGDDIIDIINREGFKDFELWGMRPHLDYRDRERLEALSFSMQTQGLRAVAFHAPFYRWDSYTSDIQWLSLANPYEDGRREALEETKKVVDIMDIFGCPLLVVHTGITGTEFWREERDMALKSLEELGSYCEKRAVHMALENGVNHYATSSIVREMVDGFPPEVLGICLDIGHANIMEDPARAVHICGERLIHLHTSDNYGDVDDPKKVESFVSFLSQVRRSYEKFLSIPSRRKRDS